MSSSENANISETILKEKEEQKEKLSVIELQLGDVINIQNPKNEKLNDQTFIIDYIDNTKMYLINVDTLEKTRLKISGDGIIGDGTITQIAILSRSDTPSYARQNDLTPGKWIDIHFAGDFPVIITGEITNLEEDMIEITTVDGDTLYINFDYKGIPEDLPIKIIEIREKPQAPKKPEQEDINVEEEDQLKADDENIAPIADLERDYRMMPTENIQLTVPVKDVRNQLREFILRADQISFGDEELGPIVQFVDVAANAQRYSIEVQLSDLLDELLSTVPNAQRTPRVLNNIHITIERFKQLREKFSTFDQYGVVESAVVNESSYKPLTQYFKNFKQNLLWILPVIKNIKKVYSNDVINEDENNDIIYLDINEDITRIKELLNNYRANDLPDDQNKYSLLYSDLNPYFTPFNLISEEATSDLLTERNVEADLNVIIDNLEDMYSSVFTNNNVRSRRFVIQKYNMGLTKLDTTDVTNSRLITTRVKMTNPDTMSIKSFVTLPESVIRFSKINLPGTTMLDRANLNQIYVNYWQMLKKKTTVNNVIIENLDGEIQFNENNFVNTIKNYVLNLSTEDKRGLNSEQIYSQFINTIIPKTKVLFDLMKKYITGKLSIVDVVSYLEPFLVYTDDLTYMQYKDITRFIDDKISEFNKKYIERSRLFQTLRKFTKSNIIFTNAFSVISIIETNENLRSDVFDAYDITIEGNDLRYNYSDYTNSELLRKITLKDKGRVYASAISIESLPLMFPSEYAALFETEKDKINKKYETEQKNDTCGPIIIAKQYVSLEELEQDNNKQIYFDKKYDKTNYTLLDSYEKEIVKMEPEELKLHIMYDLQKKLNLSRKDADYLSDTLLDGHKTVIDGQYAMLQKTNTMPDYYIRRANKWELDNDISENLKANTDDSNILCDLQEKCISVTSKNDKDEDKCMTMEADELGIQNKLLKDVLNEFDEKYRVSKDEFEGVIQYDLQYYMSILGVLTSIENNNLLKYNNQKYKLGADIDDDAPIRPISPYTGLLNLILAQSDFGKKQNDIIRFVNAYARDPKTDSFGPLNERENENWYYCKKSNVPILPIFKYDLAGYFIVKPDEYRDFLDTTISRIGKLSDDGDYWVDKNSGWQIVKIDDDLDEGYEEGFKVSSRGILEDQAGNKVFSASTKNIVYVTYENKTISNVVNAISIAMGINIESQKEFIINSVLTALSSTMESEEDYKKKIKEMAEKGKKIPSYEDFYNTGILYYTLGMFLIAVQASIPSVKTRKTHPGCVRSFNGYPFEWNNNLSSLEYLACVAFDIRESGKPWNVLKGKKTDFIVAKIKGSIDNVLIPMVPEVERKFDEKMDYILSGKEETIPDEHAITNWTQFLPPLVPFKIRRLVNISDEFKRALMSDLKSGSENQREKLLVVESKIIQFSLAIQEKIQELVKKKSMLLKNANNEPYLENSCCESKEGQSTIDYFMSQEPVIFEYNEIVQRLSNIIQDVTNYSKSGMLFSTINTKNKYPPISQNFDEKTIYLSFIYFCKFKSLIPISDDLLPLCTDKPDLSLVSGNLSLDKIIQNLKENGRKFDMEAFLRLLQLMGRKNIIPLDFDRPQVSSITKMMATVEMIDDENDEVVEGSLRKLITDALDTYDIATEETSREIKNLNDYLIRNNEEMIEDIKDFIEKHKGSDITRSAVSKFTKTIDNMSKWSCEGSKRNENTKISDDCLYSTVNFYKSFIANFVTIFPNIILNKVDYENVTMPAYLGLSKPHSNKIRKHISDYYKNLKTFYGVPSIYNILTKIQQSSRNLMMLSKDTPSFTSIKYGEKVLKPIFDERTSRFLFEYYLLRVIINYIDLTDDEEMIVVERSREVEVTDLFTVAYLEDQETRVDFDVTAQAKKDTQVLSGNKKGLKQQVSHLIIAFFEIFDNQKDVVDISYEEILDRVFKLREGEKDMITDRLKNLTDEERDADTILKINKLGVWSKGLQKGLTTYVKETYDDERDFRDEMDKIEKNLRKKNRNIGDGDLDQLVDDYIEERDVGDEIEREEYDMGNMGPNYQDGNDFYEVGPTGEEFDWGD
jgi:hypothetical protein